MKSKPTIEYVVRVRLLLTDGRGGMKIVTDEDKFDQYTDAVAYRNRVISEELWPGVVGEAWVEKLATFNCGRRGAVVKRTGKARL